MVNTFTFLHLVFVFMLLAGEGLLTGVGIRMGSMEGDVKGIRVLSGMASFTGRVIMRTAAVGLLVFGFALAHEKHYAFSSTWIGVSLVLWILAVGIGDAVLNPHEKHVKQMADDLLAKGVTQSDELQALAGDKKGAIFGNIELLLVLSLLVMMVWRPGTHFT